MVAEGGAVATEDPSVGSGFVDEAAGRIAGIDLLQLVASAVLVAEGWIFEFGGSRETAESLLAPSPANLTCPIARTPQPFAYR